MGVITVGWHARLEGIYVYGPLHVGLRFPDKSDSSNGCICHRLH